MKEIKGGESIKYASSVIIVLSPLKVRRRKKLERILNIKK